MRRSPGPTGNLLLDALPNEDRNRLLDGAAAPSVMDLHDVVQPPNAPIERVYFPTSGVVSVVTFLTERNGGAKTVEAITIGSEGMTNAHAVLGSERSGAEGTVVQVEGKAFVVPVERVLGEANRRGKFERVSHGYIQAFWALTAYGSACNAVHHVTTRCARWLLQTQDRIDGDMFFLTQEYLANMLGAERSTVSVAAGELQRRGLIEYARGRVAVRDRRGLESAACECYERMRSEYARLATFD